MKILAIKLRAIGDTVIWTSSLASLRARFPQAEIHVLTYASNEPVLRAHPAVTVVHTLKSKAKRELLWTLWRLRRERFDWLLGFHATTSLCRWAWIAGAQEMALHHHSWTYTPKGSVTIPEPGRLEDAISRDGQVLRAMGFQPERKPTHIELLEDERAWAEAQIRAAAQSPEKPRYMFLPGASHHLRRYPKDMWLPLVEKVRRENVFEPIVLCDSALSDEWSLRSECERLGVALFDKNGLRQFMALISRGERALGNDSGPSHMAVALGLDTSFVFGPGCVGDWHCYDRAKHAVFRTHVDCRIQGPRDHDAFQYCTVNACSHHSCLRKLAVQLKT